VCYFPYQQDASPERTLLVFFCPAPYKKGGGVNKKKLIFDNYYQKMQGVYLKKRSFAISI